MVASRRNRKRTPRHKSGWRAGSKRPSPRSRGLVDPRHTPYKLLIRRSGIHGLGVFAQQAIPKGKRVIEYSGERISRVETRRRFLRAWRSRQKRLYLARIDLYWAIDGARGGSGAELINHCCDPNLGWRVERGRLFFVSRRGIRRGDELTLDYAFRADGPLVPCRCGARRCRGTINTRRGAEGR